MCSPVKRQKDLRHTAPSSKSTATSAVAMLRVMLEVAWPKYTVIHSCRTACDSCCPSTAVAITSGCDDKDPTCGANARASGSGGSGDSSSCPNRKCNGWVAVCSTKNISLVWKKVPEEEVGQLTRLFSWHLEIALQLKSLIGSVRWKVRVCAV